MRATISDLRLDYVITRLEFGNLLFDLLLSWVVGRWGQLPQQSFFCGQGTNNRLLVAKQMRIDALANVGMSFGEKIEKAACTAIFAGFESLDLVVLSRMQLGQLHEQVDFEFVVAAGGRK